MYTVSRTTSCCNAIKRRGSGVEGLEPITGFPWCRGCDSPPPREKQYRDGGSPHCRDDAAATRQRAGFRRSDEVHACFDAGLLQVFAGTPNPPALRAMPDDARLCALFGRLLRLAHSDAERADDNEAALLHDARRLQARHQGCYGSSNIQPPAGRKAGATASRFHSSINLPATRSLSSMSVKLREGS